MEKADRLSKWPNWKVSIENDNKDQVFIKDCWLHNLYKVVIKEPEVNILEKIKIARSKDKEVVRIVKEMKKAEVRILQGEEWQIERDLVLKEVKVYMPKDEKLRVEIIWLHHDTLIAGHGGKWKMIELVTRNY